MRTDDGSIIHECLNGEPGAFGVLVDRYKEGIYAFVYHKLRDFRDAQDVTQEVFLQAYRGLRSLRRWESFAFWLYRIRQRIPAGFTLRVVEAVKRIKIHPMPRAAGLPWGLSPAVRS